MPAFRVTIRPRCSLRSGTFAIPPSQWSRPHDRLCRRASLDSGVQRSGCSPALERHQDRRPHRGGPMTAPLVGVVMGSDSDWSVMQHAAARLVEFGVPYETRIVSAHRTPDLLYSYATEAEGRGLRCIIAGAGGAAHLPGMPPAKTVVPVLGVPTPSKHLKGLDSLLTIVQMPTGIPVATFAIGEAGAHNAALFAIAMLARTDGHLATRLNQFRDTLDATVRALSLPDPA